MFSFRFFFSVMAAVLILTGGCSNQPSDLIEEETYINMLVEFELIHTLHEAREDTSDTKRFTEMVFDEYGVTEEQFKRSHAWYEQDISGQLERYRTALDRLNEEYGKISAAQRERDKKKKENNDID